MSHFAGQFFRVLWKGSKKPDIVFNASWTKGSETNRVKSQVSSLSFRREKQNKWSVLSRERESEKTISPKLFSFLPLLSKKWVQESIAIKAGRLNFRLRFKSITFHLTRGLPVLFPTKLGFPILSLFRRNNVLRNRNVMPPPRNTSSFGKVLLLIFCESFTSPEKRWNWRRETKRENVFLLWPKGTGSQGWLFYATKKKQQWRQ